MTAVDECYSSSSYVFGLVDNFVLYSLICASKSISFIDVANIPKILQIMYVLRLLRVFVLHLCYRFL